MARIYVDIKYSNDGLVSEMYQKAFGHDTIMNLSALFRNVVFKGSMTYALSTIAPTTNANVKPNPKPNPHPNPYPTLNQRPNHNPHNNSWSLETLSPEQMPEHRLGNMADCWMWDTRGHAACRAFFATQLQGQ